MEIALRKKRMMTVAELIAELQKIDPNKNIVTYNADEKFGNVALDDSYGDVIVITSYDFVSREDEAAERRRMA